MMKNARLVLTDSGGIQEETAYLGVPYVAIRGKYRVPGNAPSRGMSASPGNQITVRGSGFDSTIAATVGGVQAAVSVTDQNTLTLTMPAAASGPQDIVLMRGDGETYTLENGITAP